MSHHHNDEDIQMPGMLNVDNTTRRRHSHTHIHLKPADVINHIKSKVKRKRHSNQNLTEIPAFAIDNPTNGNTKRISQEQNELKPPPTLTATRSHPNISSQVGPDHYLLFNFENKTNDDESMFQLIKL
jgi:hypothetical protein